MKSDLQSLRNIGPKMEEHLLTVGINSAETLRALGAEEATRLLISSGTVDPHIMYFMCLQAAIEERNIFSFVPHEKAELKNLYEALLDEFR